MEIKKENITKTRVKLIVSLEAEEFAPYFEKACEDLAKEITLPGFRKGHVPKALAIERIGEHRIMHEATDMALPETYSKAVQQEKIFPVESPAVAIDMLPTYDGVLTGSFKFSAEVDVLPEIELGDYTKIKVKQPKRKEIKSDDVQKVIEYLQKQRADYKDADREVKLGDRVEIDFDGTVDNISDERLKSKNHPLIVGDKTLIPGFEDELVGLKKGEEKTFSITFPKDYHSKEFAGKKATFKVKINQIQEIILPTLDDKFAKELGKKDVEDLKKAIGENLELEEKERVKGEVENQVVEEVLKKLKVELPGSMVSREQDRLIEEFKHRVSYQGLTWDQYLQMLKKTEEELKGEMKSQSEKNVRFGLVLGEVIRREGLDVNDKEAPKKAIDKLVEYATK